MNCQGCRDLACACGGILWLEEWVDPEEAKRRETGDRAYMDSVRRGELARVAAAPNPVPLGHRLRDGSAAHLRLGEPMDVEPEPEDPPMPELRRRRRPGEDE